MLNELLEDYQEFNEDEALDEFLRLLWNSKYGCRTYKKFYTFNLQPSALNNNQELIDLFEPYQKIEIKHAKSYYKDKPSSIDMIRVHINNMYMYLTNEDVYLSKEYFNAKIQPKKLYYEATQKLKNGETIDVDELKDRIHKSQIQAEEFRQRDVDKKISISFREYKSIINNYILRLFNNYKPPHEYEKLYGWEITSYHNAWHEDNFIVKYFCKSLTGYMMNYMKSLKPKIEIIKKCNQCEVSYKPNSNRQKYCNVCSAETERKRQLIKWHKNKNKYKKLPN
ncbi:hypothetical protein [Lysinibacillus sp. NPDC086135]|uniref:hypothetical protein n=1 Tax=Lysinibacillus sp. NPDC086135 TaxID=3364130 RepID=UPI0038023733